MARTYKQLQSANNSVHQFNYSSIAGVDIKCVLGNVTFGNMQAISYSITREKAPIFTMGSPEARGFARGKRGIAGSMIFVMFEGHALLTAMRSLDDARFVSDRDEIRPAIRTPRLGSETKSDQDVVTKAVNSNRELTTGDALNRGWSLEAAWYVDQLPPFNVILVGVNEMGHASGMGIIGCEILNEGFGISIDDIISEQQMTFVARTVDHWQRLETPGTWPAHNNAFSISR